MSHKIFDNSLVAKQKNLTKQHILEGAFNNSVKYECANSFIITLERNMTTNQNYYSQTIILV